MRNPCWMLRSKMVIENPLSRFRSIGSLYYHLMMTVASSAG
jgi:hypothetical protein